MFFLGYQLALGEIFIFGIISFILRNFTNLLKINAIVYYWSMFTILTGIWELYFVANYSNVLALAHNLLDSKNHVWTQQYNISYLQPNLFSQIFYSEYGAYADREYMDKMDNWSRVIESSHSLLCGFFCLVAIGSYLYQNLPEYWLSLSIAMGSQLMNSILYLANYFNQVHEPYSVNYNTSSFPSGNYLEKRPFMYINIFWTMMPLYVILNLLHSLRYTKKHASTQTISEDSLEKENILEKEGWQMEYGENEDINLLETKM
jgi:hypothetical protein